MWRCGRGCASPGRGPRFESRLGKKIKNPWIHVCDVAVFGPLDTGYSSVGPEPTHVPICKCYVLSLQAQQQLEREEAERKLRDEADRQAKLKEEEEKRKAAEEEMRIKREEAEREEKERLARKQRVEAIMARTRAKKVGAIESLAALRI